jgi:diguanylate cyclase (GGDEF)-like protein/PAS domain S-box-containing protein
MTVLALAGWLLGSHVFVGRWGGGISMPPATALALLFLSGGVFSHARWSTHPSIRRVVVAAAGLAAVLGLLILAQFITGRDWGVELALARASGLFGRVPPGPMSPFTAAGVLLESGALLFLLNTSRWRFAASVATLLGAVVTIVSLVILLAYSYGTPMFYGGAIVPVSMSTALAMVLVGVAQIELTLPAVPGMRAWRGDTTRGMLAHAFLPVMLAFMIVQSWVEAVAALEAGMKPLWDALTVLVMCVLIVAVIVLVARRVGDTIERAQRAVRESEAKFRELFDSAPVAYHELDLDGVVRRVNQVECALLGYEAAEMLGRPVWKFIAKSELEASRELFRRKLSGEQPLESNERRYVRRDGGELWIEVRDALVTDATGETIGIRSALLDITKRKRAEEALREAQAVLNGVLNSMPVRVFWKDRNLVYLGCNPAFARDAGFEQPEDIIGKDDHALSWREQAERYQADDRAVIESGVAKLFFEELQATPAGEQIHLLTSKVPLRNAGGAIVGMMGTYLDNTERKRAEEALRVSEARLRGIADSAQDAILIMDHSGAISFWNPAAESILGYRREEAIGENLHKLLAPERYFEAHSAAFPEFLCTGRGNAVGKTLEMAARRKDGREIAIDLSLSAVCLNGEWCAVGIMRDITGRKQAEEALRASNEHSRMLARALQCVDDCISITDVEDRILYVNEAFRRTYGYRDDEVIGRNIRMLRSQRTSTKILDEILPATVAGSWQGEIWNRTKGGRDFPISLGTSVVYDEGGQTVALVGIARDITERKREEEELRAKEYSLSESQRIAHVGSWNWELPIGTTVCAWTPETYRLFGVSPDTFVPSLDMFQSLIHPDDRAAMQAWIGGCLAGEERDLEFRVCLSGGRVRYLLGRGHLVRDAENKPIRMAGITQDVTERRRAEEEVRRANTGLSTLVRQLEVKGAQETILIEMRTFLQACSSVRELAPVVAHSMRRLFPNSDGALFLLSPSGTDFETAARWGDAGEEPAETVLSLDSCWALRRGCLHVVADPKSGLICPHMRHLAATAYVCMPLTADGKVLGLLHLRSRAAAPPAEAHETIATLEGISSMLSEMLSLSISNLQMSETLRMQSIRDPLTGLFNRRYMEETLEREIHRAARNKKQFSVVMVDIDYFKTFNDLHGHAAGDLVLTELAGLIRSQMRGGDIPCRYGGDELTLVLLESSLEDTVAWCKGLQEKVKKLKLGYFGREIGPIGLSLGVSVYPANGPKVEDLLQAADDALYRAKQEGRDRVVPASKL